jgi:hypothetical protein
VAAPATAPVRCALASWNRLERRIYLDIGRPAGNDANRFVHAKARAFREAS